MTRTRNGGPRQNIGSSGELVFARALRMSLASSTTAAATRVYSPGTRKYKEKECLDSLRGGASMVIPFRTPTKKPQQARSHRLYLSWY